MSDVSFIPEDAWATIERGKRKAILIIDCLSLQSIKSHMGVRDTAATIQRLSPKRSYLTGFNHDLSHEEWVMIGEAVGKKFIDTSDMTQEVKDGIALFKEGVSMMEMELKDNEKIAIGDEYRESGIDDEVNLNQEKGCWVRPSHDGLRVFVDGDTIRDETYD